MRVHHRKMACARIMAAITAVDMAVVLSVQNGGVGSVGTVVDSLTSGGLFGSVVSTLPRLSFPVSALFFLSANVALVPCGVVVAGGFSLVATWLAVPALLGA